MQRLGLDLDALGVRDVNKLLLTSESGKVLNSNLKKGGMGISRYTLDAELARLAREAGCEVLDNTKVDDVASSGHSFIINYGQRSIHSKVVAGAYGKKSNIDLQLKRRFALRKPPPKENFVAVKYHVSCENFNDDTIELHNFNGGYCGMSAIEDNKYCLCYLTTAASLRSHGSLEQLEESVLKKNPYLKERLDGAVHLYEKPVTISQVTFGGKTAIDSHMLMLGDAAGTIAPLCGNGMSMSMRASGMLCSYITGYLSGALTRTEMENEYAKEWGRTFKRRIIVGRSLQSLLGRPVLTNYTIAALNLSTVVTNGLIRLTHGKAF